MGGQPGAIREELKESTDLVRALEQKGREATVTLVYAAHDELHNSALVIKQIIEKNLKTSSSPGKKGVSDISGYFCAP